ncbi:MAG: hypothetical protein H0A75_02125 [Candidatus Methanofishera endochildressiae]|uniref:Uncharacterized protein n=1 Tax=Candidatus Methanofishera endochildressiae TaxID=2738884 RepID=A0A7Z0MMW1_9GAMM|nr:hypothetical protein [Candidatus Methanofishera endochildressiae]
MALNEINTRLTLSYAEQLTHSGFSIRGVFYCPALSRILKVPDNDPEIIRFPEHGFGFWEQKGIAWDGFKCFL